MGGDLGAVRLGGDSSGLWLSSDRQAGPMLASLGRSETALGQQQP